MIRALSKFAKQDLLFGNAAYIVNKETGIVETGTARPIDHYIEEYEARLKKDKGVKPGQVPSDAFPTDIRR